MKQKILKKYANITKNDIFKSFFLLFLAILTIFVFINSYYLQFIINGFYQIFDANIQVYYLNVGQASASVVIFPNGSSMIIDTGSQDSEAEFLKSVDLIFSQNKIKHLDYLVLTHSDEDHVGGAVGLLEKYQVYTIYRPKILSQSKLENENTNGLMEVDTFVYAEVMTSVLSEPNCDVLFVEDSTMKMGHETTLRFWAAKNTIYSQTNSYSPFITIDYAEKTFMFTGDAPEVREKEFLAELEDKNISVNVDFLAVSHHGSKSSSTMEFLQEIKPQYAFISAGDVQHPTDEVLDRLEEVGVEDVFVTKNCGMVAVGVDQNQNIVIKFEARFVDLPLICVIMCCFAFIVANINLNDRKTLFSHKKIKNLYKIKDN